MQETHKSISSNKGLAINYDFLLIACVHNAGGNFIHEWLEIVSIIIIEK